MHHRDCVRSVATIGTLQHFIIFDQESTIADFKRKMFKCSTKRSVNASSGDTKQCRKFKDGEMWIGVNHSSACIDSFLGQRGDRPPIHIILGHFIA